MKGVTSLELFTKYPGDCIRYSNGILKWKEKFTIKRNWKMEIILILGPSGVGKSRLAHKLAEERKEPYYTKNNTKWWDGYEGEPFIIWDDFEMPQDLSRGDLLTWLDRYPCIIQLKGSHTQLRSKTIVFTCKLDPWLGDEDFTRRITRTIIIQKREGSEGGNIETPSLPTVEIITV